MGNIDKVFH